MGQNLQPKSLVPAAYIPTAPRTGSEGGFLYRMKNMILRGATGHDYIECYGGNKDLAENIPELNSSGVGDYVVGALTVPGIAGPAWRSEFRPGQFIYVTATPRAWQAVEEVLTDALLSVSRPIPVTAATQVLRRPPVIFEVNKKRGTLITGNAIQFDKGTIICAGTGTLRLNGAVLPGTSLVATKRPKIALFDPTASTYTVFTLGMTTPATLTAALIAGPFPKLMLPGLYSLYIVPARKATLGYNNPSPKAEVTLATVGDRVQLTIPATDTTNGQDAWRIYASTFTEQGGSNGPWYFVKQINAPGDVAAAGGTYDLEWLDSEISGNERLTFDNDAPPECEFVAAVAGYPVYVSCQGPGYSVAVTSATNANPVVFTTTIPHYFTTGQQVVISGGTGAWAAVNGTFPVIVISAATFSIPVNSAAFGALAGTIIITVLATSPGPFIVPAKPNNIEAAPLKYAVSPSPPEAIIGCVSAQGRLYLMTANTLQIAEFINFLSTDPNIPPLTIRPLWRAGFKNPYQLCFVDGTLYGYTTQGPTRSVSYGDEGSEEHTFAAPIREITDNWVRPHVLVAHDPINNAVCFFHTDDSTTAGTFPEGAFHTTRVLMFGLDRQAWIGDIILESATGDMYVTGVATVNGRLEFLAGGLQSNSTTVFRTYHFDSRIPLDGGAATAIPYYVAWQFSDFGSEMRDKTVKSIRVTGKITSSTAGIHGAGAGEIVDVPVLEAGNSGSKSGTIALTNTTAVAQGPRIQTNVPNLGVLTARVDGTWAGSAVSAVKDRVDECVVEVTVGGVRR